MPAATKPSASRLPLYWTVLSLLLIAGLAWLAYAPWLATGLLGFDSYPTILTARIESVSDFFGTFSEELMDGRFRPGGHFFRPFTNLTFALDYQRAGLEPRIYHETDLAILIACGCFCFAFVRRTFGASRLLTASFAGLLFVLHPIQVEVLPVPPRRADMLTVCFVLATLSLQGRRQLGESLPRWRSALALLATLAALGAKETGLIVLPLVLCLHALEAWLLPAREGQRRGAGVILRHALRSSRPTMIVTLLFMSLRTWALGGLGGHPDSRVSDLLRLPTLVEPYFDWLFLPEHFQASGALVLGLVAILLLLIGVAWIALRPSQTAAPLFVSAEADPEQASAQARVGLALTGLFLLALFAVHSMAGERVEPWYAAVFCAPYVIWLGMLLDVGVSSLRARRFVGAVPMLLFPLLLGTSHLRVSALFHDYDSWQRATVASDAFLERFDTTLNGATLGSALLLDRLPLGMPPPTNGPGVRSAVMLNTYTLEAYAELTRPGVKIRVHTYKGQSPTRVEDDVIEIWVTPAFMNSGVRR